MKKFCSHCLKRKLCIGKSALCDYKCDDYEKDEVALAARNKRIAKKVGNSWRGISAEDID